MKRQVALGLALAMLVTSTAVEAQMGGLLRRKAAEALKKKAEPAPAPETPAAPPSTPVDPGEEPTATPPAPATPEATTPEATDAASALETSALPVRQSAVQVLRGRINVREGGDWDQLPFIPPLAAAAAYALDESAQVMLVETVGAALKAAVMSAPFRAEHDAYVTGEHQGVDHGLKGVVGIEEAMAKNDMTALEAIQTRQAVAMNVDMVSKMPGDFLKSELSSELTRWKARAADANQPNRAKYQKLVAQGTPLEALDPTGERFLRGYAVLKSIDNDGPDTEEAVFALHQRVNQEREQVAYDRHNLSAQLRQQLTAFIAIASKVNFAAPTVEKDETTVFVNPADEQQGALWKACFRAGAAPTAAAVALARGWLAEL